MATNATISIITVVYNNRAELEQTIRNVAAQTYPNIEYIVVDGGSTDGTLHVIEANLGTVTRYITERDKGLYDAMNKGLKLATGDYVWFVNSGDFIAENDTLQRIADQFAWQHDIYYGETLLVQADGTVLGTRSALTTRKVPAVLNWRSFRFGQLVGHQSFIAKRSLVGEYNLSYPCSADMDWQIRAMKQAQSIQHAQLPLSRFLVGGHSAQNKKSCWQERFHIFATHYGWFTALTSHVYIVFRALKFKIAG